MHTLHSASTVICLAMYKGSRQGDSTAIVRLPRRPVLCLCCMASCTVALE